MKAIFTNKHGDVNVGYVMAIDPGGMVKVHRQRFNAMINRVVMAKPSEKQIAEKSLGERIAWVRPHDTNEHGSTLVLLSE